MTPPLLVLGSTFLGLVLPGESGNFLRATKASEEDVDASLASELANTVDKGRLSELESALRPTFTILPKNARGNLEHKAVRYVLHRLFVQRHGWYIKGLEPNTDLPRVSPSSAPSAEWVPSYLQERLERRMGDRGTSLHELAAFAAALEDLVRREAVARLRVAYEIHELPLDGAIQREQLDSVIETYYVSFLSSNNFSASGPTGAEAEKKRFASKYTGWSEAREWLEETVGAVRTPDEPGEGRFSFSAATRMALKIGEEYHAFNDLECKSLKYQLQKIEGRKPGRVRLSAFYSQGLYSHWEFNEKADYLRALGALDETDASQPQVILPNYLMARTNCLESSDLYALCCQNECEDLMGHLEQKIGAPKADVDQIIALVARLPSATVAAPRNLSAALVGRLTQIAEQHGQRVPIHGRLFAQWMHHAFPRECPYPHESGAASPQTPDEWMQGTGQLSTRASKEEMLEQVEGDTGAAAEECTELPWSHAEELLTAHSSLPAARSGFCAKSLLLLAAAAALALVLALDRQYSQQQPGGLLGKDPATAAGLRALLACISLGSLACAFDLLDTKVLAFALLAGVCVQAYRARALAAPRLPHYKSAKSCM